MFTWKVFITVMLFSIILVSFKPSKLSQWECLWRLLPCLKLTKKKSLPQISSPNASRLLVSKAATNALQATHPKISPRPSTWVEASAKATRPKTTDCSARNLLAAVSLPPSSGTAWWLARAPPATTSSLRRYTSPTTSSWKSCLPTTPSSAPFAEGAATPVFISLTKVLLLTEVGGMLPRLCSLFSEGSTASGRHCSLFGW